MPKYIIITLIFIAALSACNKAANKKVLIMGRGTITTNGNDVSMKDGTGYTEETVEVSADKPISWSVTTPAGKTTVDIPAEPGFYILNLKTDTIVGSRQVMGNDLSSNHVITQEELRHKIDSLIKLTSGANILAGHNYIVMPGKLTKIADNIDINVYGPFTKIPGTLQADKNGKAPELYKFYTNEEMRELISRLKKLTY